MTLGLGASEEEQDTATTA